MSMNIFKLEEYLSRYEFSAPYLLCCSDPESFAMQEIIDMAEPEDKKLWDNLRLNYTEAKGLPVLCEQIARKLYPELSSDNITCFAGAEEGIFCALYTICEPGDHVIGFSPAYQSLIEIPKLKGAEVSILELKEENKWRIDLEEIKSSIRANTKAIVINFPHNPTGQIITEAELRELVAICEKNGIWLFSDEVYRLLGNPTNGWAPPAAVIYPKAISLGVTSKAFGMAGLRVGWLACQDKEILKKIEHVKYYTSICNSAPSEIITLIMLKNKDAILERNNNIVAANLNLLDEFMEEYKHFFEWVRPSGGCVGFVKYKEKESIEIFADKLVKEKEVLLLPASIYDMNSNHFRIGFGRKNMPESLAKLKEFLNENI